MPNQVVKTMYLDIPDIFIHALDTDNVHEVDRLLRLHRLGHVMWDVESFDNKKEALFPLGYALEHKKFHVAHYLLTHTHPNEMELEKVLELFCQLRFGDDGIDEKAKRLPKKALFNFLDELDLQIQKQSKQTWIRPLTCQLVRFPDNLNLIPWLQKHHWPLNAYDANGDMNTLIHALARGRIQNALKLIKGGVNVHWKTPLGANAVHFTYWVFQNKDLSFEKCCQDYTRLMDSLIKAGSDLTLKAWNGQTPKDLHIAKTDGKTKVWLEMYWDKYGLNQTLPRSLNATSKPLRL